MDIISYALSKKGMQQSVSDYLDEHLTNPTNPPLDTSLTIANAAADSKATGDKLSELKEDLSAMQTATASDIGKALKAKTVADGKVTEWEFGEAGGGEDYSEDIEELRSAVFYEKTESMVNIPTTNATANVMWGFRLPDINTKTVTVAPAWNVTSGTYTAKRWHCDDATFPSSAVLTEVETKTGNIGEAVTFDDVTPNDFITFLSDVTTDRLIVCSTAAHEYNIPLGKAITRNNITTYSDGGAYFASTQFDIIVDGSNFEKKLDKNQGTENADKVLTVNADGSVSAKAIPDQLGYKQYIEYTTGLWLTDGKNSTSVANRCRTTQRISLPAGKVLTVEPYMANASVYPIVYVWNSGNISSDSVITINNGASDKSVITLQYNVDKIVAVSWVSVSGVDASAFVGLTYITHRIDDILPSDVLEGKNLIRSAITANTFYGYYQNGNLPPEYVPTNKAEWWQTGLIPVIAGHTYEGFITSLAIDWFDYSKSFLSTTAAALNNGSVTAPTGASYGRFVYAMATYTTDHLYDITDCNREAENYLPSAYLNDNVKSDYLYKNINAVAFGTSLTYRATHRPGGYLNIVEMESGITFDNQGIGSSFIKEHNDSPSMMDAITGYTGYADKNLILLEGFVNDWFYEGPVGTYTDDDDTSICGCVRIAINYIKTQAPTATLVMILDHYGQPSSLYDYVDCSSTAVSTANGKTQYEMYEEIAKVAESLGIPVIKEYAMSGISEKTPQYLEDNIHLSRVGVMQSGKFIWNELKKLILNFDSMT